MKKAVFNISVFLFLAVSIALGIYGCLDLEAKTNEEDKMIWSDEFNYSGLPDSTKWSYDIGDACDIPAGCGWGNAELQYYTDKNLKNARVENGHLIIEAHKEDMRNSKYTSARLVTRKKGDWKYGRVEVRAKLPSGLGTWPAIWMLSTEWKNGGWPESGEIDIMEHVGFMPDSILGTVHTSAFNHSIHTQRGDSIMISDVERNFHNYSINWNEDKIDFFVDDLNYFTFKNEGKGTAEWPFDEYFHLIINLAVGGNWGGARGVDDTIWPQQLVVDYVRVYSPSSKSTADSSK